MKRAILLRGGAVAALAVLLVGCGGAKKGAGAGATTAASACSPVDVPAAKKVKLKAPKQKLAAGARVSATVATNCGSFTIALDTKRAPKTSASFVYLARKHVYDNTLVHRIQTGFVVQGGDPLGTGLGNAGYTVDEKPPSNLAYTLGTVAMARSPVEPPGRSGSQFFVVTAADAGLDPTYALLGKISSGLDAVKKIETAGSPSGQPTATVVISRVTVAGA
ncbi:MAG: hypothetical protein QOG09_1179 [Solirubrobacterales bacterium]|nr:hypothetical protein [Solirubrobacterales bacterium]